MSASDTDFTRRRILADHTYDRRAEQVEDLLLNAFAWKSRKSA